MEYNQQVQAFIQLSCITGLSQSIDRRSLYREYKEKTSEPRLSEEDFNIELANWGSEENVVYRLEHYWVGIALQITHHPNPIEFGFYTARCQLQSMVEDEKDDIPHSSAEVGLVLADIGLLLCAVINEASNNAIDAIG